MLKYLAMGACALLMLCAVVSAAAPLAPGDDAPEISAESWIKRGNVRSLVANTSTVFVVEFWATWCAPCEMSIPHLNRLHDRLKARDVYIVGLTDEDEDTVRAFQEEVPMHYAVGTGSTSGNDYAVRGIPTAFVIKNQQVLWSGHPLQGLDRAVARALGDPFEPENAAAVVGESIIGLASYHAFVTAAMGDANMEEAPEVSKYRLLDLLIQRTQLMARLDALDLSVKKQDVADRFAAEKAEYEGMPENKGKTFESFLNAKGVSRFLRHEMVYIDLATQQLAERGFDPITVRETYEVDPASHHRAHVHHIMVKVDDWSDAEAVEAARDRIESIRDAITGGGDFQTQAKRNSAGRRASHGGDWGWMGKGGLTAIDTAMFELPIGEISEVLPSRAGFHIIKVIARKDTFDSLKADLRQELLHERKLDILRELTEDESIRRNPYL